MTKPTSTRVQQLLARSRGKAARPMPVPGLAEAPRIRSEQAAALDRTLAAGKRLDPPGRKPRRNWFLHAINRGETCNECGRVIEPNADRYLDTVSGHLVRHVECHGKAEVQR